MRDLLFRLIKIKAFCQSYLRMQSSMWDLSKFRTEENPIDTLGALGADLSQYFYIWCQWLSDSMWSVFFFSCCIMAWTNNHFSFLVSTTVQGYRCVSFSCFDNLDTRNLFKGVQLFLLLSSKSFIYKAQTCGQLSFRKCWLINCAHRL